MIEEVRIHWQVRLKLSLSDWLGDLMTCSFVTILCERIGHWIWFFCLVLGVPCILLAEGFCVEVLKIFLHSSRSHDWFWFLVCFSRLEGLRNSETAGRDKLKHFSLRHFYEYADDNFLCQGSTVRMKINMNWHLSLDKRYNIPWIYMDTMIFVWVGLWWIFLACYICESPCLALAQMTCFKPLCYIQWYLFWALVLPKVIDLISQWVHFRRSCWTVSKMG